VTTPAYDQCREIARAAGSSFYAGMRLLPPERRFPLFAVYALARRIDDIADGELAPDAKLAELELERARLHPLDPRGDPVLVAIADAASHFPIPLDAFDDLVDGAEMDARGTVYETFDQLERYCRCVAGSIGRLSLGVFDCSDRERGARLADELGVSLQIGNVLRDVAEDAGRGRVYLPLEDLERFDCTVEDGVFDGPLELVVAFEAERGLQRLRRGLELVPLIDRRSATCVLAMAGKYRRLLERIAADPGIVLRGRLTLRPWEKGLVLARSLAGMGVGSTEPVRSGGAGSAGAGAGTS
jgi:15-cis-phytoene synthase